MSVQVLIATMHQEDCLELVKNMNIQSDALIINQCEKNKVDMFSLKSKKIECFSFQERGVGRSRNNALLRCSAEICLFADDDMIYVDGYEKIVEEEFGKYPEADIILFSLESLNPNRPLSKISNSGRVGKKEAMRYGCARIAFKRDKVLQANVWFSLLFGGGAKYSSGEDTIFLQECLKKGLKIYKSTAKIADVKQESSTWFDGYSEKLFFDKGVLLATVRPKTAKIYALGLAYKYSKKSEVTISFLEIFRMMLKGISYSHP